jgi:hypothetical protein
MDISFEHRSFLIDEMRDGHEKETHGAGHMVYKIPVSSKIPVSFFFFLVNIFSRLLHFLSEVNT